ncbi:MAG: tetraacyldisaccharide 4'-kinase [Proteobacteria bacterium]|nr:tetraacyldisaccharide 4'-kinase [Pseudomonadota bacterium]
MPEWIWRREESWGRRLALSPLAGVELLYRAGADLHRAAYARGWRPRTRLPCRVVSVGNLSVGGSGKSPLVGWLARELHARGRIVAILSRGVGGASTAQVSVVSDGSRLLLSPAEAGDEPVMLAGQTPGVPVLAGRNRVALGLRAAAAFGVELCLLDDGFQHHRLARDLDLVCIDAASGLGNGHVLPRGPLRESPRGLRRADALLWVNRRAAEVPRGRWIPRGVPEFRVRIEPRRLRRLGGGKRELDWLAGRRVGVLAAIARPDRLVNGLEDLGARVASLRLRPDHHAYRRSDIQALDPSLTWLTTAKDAVKIPADWVGETELWALEEEVEPEDAGALVDFVVRRIDAAGESP